MSAPGLAGRGVLVTGAAGGIGGAVAALLRAEGARVVASDLRIDAPGLACDVADAAAVARLLDAAAKDGPLWGVVHAAALTGASGRFDRIDAETWRRFVAVNLSGAFHVLQGGARAMLAGGQGGRLVAIGSVNAFAAEAHAAPYAASKGGLRLLVKAIAADLGGLGIAANLVHPGPITVPRNAEAFAEAAPLLAQHLPEGRPGTPQDVARAVRFLLDPVTAFLNGADLVIDGGLTARILSGSPGTG